jgi:RNA polymerase sigma-70 factor (ECF subfamily)
MPRAPASLDLAREAALLSRARSEIAAEREAAFEEIFVELREPVLALCLHLTGRHADAEDALEVVFLAVHEALPGFRGESRPFTWVYRIAIRAALRVKARRPRKAAPLEADPVAPREGDPLVAREDARRLEAALARLSAEHRVVVSLCAI